MLNSCVALMNEINWPVITMAVLLVSLMLVIQMIVLLIVYPINQLCLRKLRQKWLSGDQQECVKQFDAAHSYFKNNVTSPVSALKEGMLFIPELVLISLLAIGFIFMCAFILHTLNIFIPGTSPYERLIASLIIGVAILFQFDFLNNRFIKHKAKLDEQLQQLNVSKEYIQKRKAYDKVLNVSFFTLGLLLWVPFLAVISSFNIMQIGFTPFILFLLFSLFVRGFVHD